MPGDSLHEAVAQSIWAAVLAPRADAVLATEQAAATTIGMVLAEAERSIKALRGHDSLGGEVESIEDDAPPGSGWLLERSDVVEALAALARI